MDFEKKKKDFERIKMIQMQTGIKTFKAVSLCPLANPFSLSALKEEGKPVI